MTPKERAAMQQALKAVHNSANALLFLARDCEMRNSSVDDCNEAITALREALAEQAEQEPVDWTYTRKGIYDKLTELGASIVQSCCNVPDKRCGADEWLLQTVQIELLLDALAAPVRTKDLTDDEIEKAVENITFDENFDINIARAVIAADREKNK